MLQYTINHQCDEMPILGVKKHTRRSLWLGGESYLYKQLHLIKEHKLFDARRPH